MLQQVDLCKSEQLHKYFSRIFMLAPYINCIKTIFTVPSDAQQVDMPP